MDSECPGIGARLYSPREQALHVACYDEAMNIRPATVHDVPAIARVISLFSERGIMLFRSHAELYEAIRDFFVAELNGVIVGVCALEIVWADLAEVRSLAVDPSMQGCGIGSALVRAVEEEARRLEIRRIFSLTYEQRFFQRAGFTVVEKSALPTKVWSVCIKCPKRLGCDEIAMVKTVWEGDATEEPSPDTHAELRYEVPTQLQIRGKRV
jgi:amino-acid N-acetyltransferase